MAVQHVEVLVEEPSMEAALRLLLPRLLRNTSFGVYPYQCKSEMLLRLPERLRGYSSWLPADWRIVVLMDRDDDDCHELKGRLEEFARQAGLTTRSSAGGRRYSAVNRLAIEELEAWFFGDWEAVLAAFGRAPADIPRKARYRDPDAIKGGTREAFERVLRSAGYFRSGMPRIEVAREIAVRWEPARNSSASFRAFRDVLSEMAS